MKERGAYQPKKASDLDAIEARRIAGGFTVDELARKAGMSRRTYERMRKSGRGFLRRIKALQMALRTLESERRREGEVFPFAVPERSAAIAPDQPPRPFADGPQTGGGPGNGLSRAFPDGSRSPADGGRQRQGQKT